MISRNENSVPVGTILFHTLLALVLGAALPLVTLLQILLLAPVLMLSGILLVRFHTRAGWVPAGAFMAVGLASTAWFLDPKLMWMLLAAGVLPALFTIRGIARKRPFFEQMRDVVLLYVLGMMAAIVMAYASFGGDMIARFMDVMRAEFERMPDALFQPVVEAMNSALMLNSGTGAITVEIYRSQMMGVLDLMQQAYAESLPGTLLTGAMLSGVISVLWGNWAMARRGMATNESFIGMGRWFLPARISLGALGIWVVSFLIANSQYSAGRTVYVTVYRLISCAFAIQALAALDRRMLQHGRSLTTRKVLLTLLGLASLVLPTLGTVFFLIGALSALFGRRGAVRLWLEKRRDDHSNDDF